MLEGAGVAIGRFQTPALHSAHIQLLARISEHKTMVVLLGVNPAGPTRKNPMDFQTRQLMILETFPHAIVLPVYDMPSNARWSEQVDSILRKACPFASKITLYGGRDSFAKCYKGKYKVKICMDEAPDSATVMREKASSKPIRSADFRAGVIYGVYNRFPIIMPTVDFALIDDKNGRYFVLLGKKKAIKGHVFPGGFLGPGEDPAHAAVRELDEETGLIPQGGSDDVEFICARPISSDWRSKRDDVNIVTMFFTGFHSHGVPKAADDLDDVNWFEVSALREKDMAEPHAILLMELQKHLRRHK